MEQQTTEILEQKSEDAEANTSVEENNAEETGEVQEGSRFEHVKETLDLLCREFPLAFIKDGEVKPLKIGIFDDLKAAIASKPGFSLSKVRAALRLYTTRLKYFESLKIGAKRVDLNGTEGDEVSLEHADFAAEKIAEIRAKIKVKRIPRKALSKNERTKVSETKKKRQNRIPGVKPAAEELTVGKEVMVLTGENHYIYGIISAHDQNDKVIVTLKTGMTVNVTVDRILLPKQK